MYMCVKGISHQKRFKDAHDTIRGFNTDIGPKILCDILKEKYLGWQLYETNNYYIDTVQWKFIELTTYISYLAECNPSLLPV